MAETCKRDLSLSTRNWSGLPNDLLESIFERLENDLKDGLSFSAVCKQWRLMAAEKGRHVIPGIMLVAHDQEDPNTIANIFSLASSDNSYKTYVPKVKGRHCYGSVNGLLIIIDIKSGRTYLFNPVSGKHVLVKCPSVLAAEKIEQDIINRVDLFGNIDEDYLVVIFRETSKLVHFCKRGRKNWSTVRIKFGGVQNIGHHGGKLYVISVSGTIEIFDTQRSSGPSKSSIIKVRKPWTGALQARFDEVKYLDVPFKNEDGWISHTVCLVETPKGELLITIELVESYEKNRLKTRGFTVLKLDKSVGDWTQVESLGECVLFVGMKSICLMVHDVPGCQANSIYFTNPRDWNDMGVFNMEDKTVKPLYENCPFKLSPMTWFTPSLRKLG